MRKMLLPLTAASAIVAAVSVAPAMTVGTASGLRTAMDNASSVEQVVYVCRHRYYSSRRVCWWRPTYRPWRRRYW
jgi:hypothetical protein